MADILFNKSGVPLIAYGKSYQATTAGTPAEKPKNTSQPKNPDEDKLTVGNIQVSAWGTANDFPKKADEISQFGIKLVIFRSCFKAVG